MCCHYPLQPTFTAPFTLYYLTDSCVLSISVQCVVAVGTQPMVTLSRPAQEHACDRRSREPLWLSEWWQPLKVERVVAGFSERGEWSQPQLLVLTPSLGLVTPWGKWFVTDCVEKISNAAEMHQTWNCPYTQLRTAKKVVCISVVICAVQWTEQCQPPVAVGRNNPNECKFEWNCNIVTSCKAWRNGDCVYVCVWRG